MMLLRILLALALLTGSAQAQMNSFFPGPGTAHSTGGGCSEATTFLARTSGLDATHQTAYTTMICGMVTDGTWTKMDALYIFATNTTTTANLNLKSTSYGLTQTGSVSFTADQGYTGDGSTGYLNTGFIPSTAGGNYTQNSASFGAYIRTSRTTGASYAAIATDVSNTGQARWNPNYNSINANWQINDASFRDIANANAQGFWGLSRTASTTANLYKNSSGTAFDSITNASTGLSASSFTILAENRSGGVVDFSADQLAAAFIGGGLSSAEWVNLQSRINAYMTTVGANVY